MFKNWKSLEANLGTDGSEHGEILVDEELINKSRITIEKIKERGDYFALTVGIYGILVHTAYFKYLNDAQECSDSLKLVIQVLLDVDF